MLTQEEISVIKSASQATGFYDNPIWKQGDPKPDYFDLFEWSAWVGLGFNHGKEFLIYDNFGGTLKEEYFDTLEKKIYYLQGIFENLSDGAGIQKGENWIQFANSPRKVEMCKKWLNEIWENNIRSKSIEDFLEHGVIEHKIFYAYPICHTIYIQPKLVEFIKNYKDNHE